jgi:phosphoribosylaminoimidazole-succinocarboxamide synthase
MNNVVLKTDLEGVRLLFKGKVRDVYDLEDKLLIIATDRISAFDSVLPNGIPCKGKVLNLLSEYWFNFTADIVKNHLINTDVDRFPYQVRGYSELLRDRSMLVKKARRIDIECVVRGYLAGSVWGEYKNKGTVCSLPMPKGLKESEELPEPIFTPTIKSNTSHDVNTTEEKVAELVGENCRDELKDKSISVYEKAAKKAESKGMIIADTKFEFGIYNDELILIDELLTPDSSRLWSLENYQVGMPQESFDKQFVRDYLEGIGWNRKPPSPSLPNHIVEKTTQKYLEAYKRITGRALCGE